MSTENERTKEIRYKETLATLEDIMSKSTNAYSTMAQVLDAVVDAVNAEAGTLWYYDRFNIGNIFPRATSGRVLLDMTSLDLGEGVAGSVIETGTPVIVPDCQKDPRWAGRVDAKTGFTTKSMICVPLTVKKAVFGCIQIINKKDDSAYDEDDLELVTKLSQGLSALFLRYGLLSKEWMKFIGVDKTYGGAFGESSAAGSRSKGTKSQKSDQDDMSLAEKFMLFISGKRK